MNFSLKYHPFVNILPYSLFFILIIILLVILFKILVQINESKISIVSVGTKVTDTTACNRSASSQVNPANTINQVPTYRYYLLACTNKSCAKLYRVSIGFVTLLDSETKLSLKIEKIKSIIHLIFCFFNQTINKEVMACGVS